MKQVQNQAPTFESVWALLEKNAQERKKSQASFDRWMKKSNASFDRWMKKSNAKFDREMAESRADFDRRMAEAERIRAQTNADAERRIKKLEKLTGSWASNYGTFAEEYFYNSFERGQQNFFGEKFDAIEKNLSNFWQGLRDEYDIVLFNHTSVALIEVKYKAHVNDLPNVIKKAETFRILFPHYKDFKVYLGFASLSFYPELEQRCLDEGIAIIKQVGDTVVIIDSNLRVF